MNEFYYNCVVNKNSRVCLFLLFFVKMVGGDHNVVSLFVQDVFYLTVDELFAFVEGRSVTNDLSGLVELRRAEYEGYKKVTSDLDLRNEATPRPLN